MMGAAIPPAGSQDLSALFAILASPERCSAALAELVKARDDAEASNTKAIAGRSAANTAWASAQQRAAEVLRREAAVTAREHDVEAKAEAMEISALKAADALAARETALAQKAEKQADLTALFDTRANAIEVRTAALAQREAEVAALKATYDSALAKLKASVQAQLEKAFTP